MSIKKYTNGSWTPACRKYGTETGTITTFPATIIGDGTPISSYTIKGNMEQSGTPTPSSPIYPSECGERTENLFDYADLEGGFIDINTGENTPNENQKRTKNYITVQANTTYTLSNYDGKCRVHMYSNNSYLGNVLTNESQYSFTTNSNCTRIRIAGFKDNFFETTMLILGSTAPTSYIPYGYKLPITLGSTTTDIYLGEVQSTRRVKKLVLTGETAIYKNDSNSCLYYLINQPHKAIDCVCSHLMSTVSYPTDEIGGVYLTDPSRPSTIYINLSRSVMEAQSSGNTVAGFKEYLAAQYAAGTPVTVWYVLAEPETAVVNEPIRKIGDYVDSVSGTGLATSGAGQAFDINTTLKPSEVDMTYHGWHEHADTKFTT